jgi:hypothetical protein
MLKRLEIAMNVYNQAKKQIEDSLLIGGKTMIEWRKEFYSIQIPQDANPIIAKELAIRIMRLNEVASQYFGEANARYAILANNQDSSYRKAFGEIVRSYLDNGQKVPAKDRIEIEAKNETQKQTDMLTFAELEKNFWRDMLNRIERCRKELESINLNNSLILKSESFAGTPGSTSFNPDDVKDEENF